MMFNPYQTLKIPRDASPAEIKSAYRKLAREHHPDHRPGDKRAEDRFKDISNAYALLSNTIKRRQFDSGEIDAHGHPFAHARTSSARASGAQGYQTYRRNASSEFKAKKSRFNAFFNDRKSIKAKGADVTYTLKVSFLEAAAGAVKTVRLATGKALKVRVPAGTENGQTLRLKNQGMEGIGGGASGDALVEIIIQTDLVFRADGLDVHCEEPVTLPEAVLGGRIEVRTVHGPVMMTVPEDSNSGTKLRLKGRGIHRSNSTQRGDHYVTLKVALPHRTDADLKKFVKKWSAKNPYAVRKETLKRNAAE